MRLRPDGGLNLSRFIQGGDWGARLYRLQSKLFEGTALSGVWELAIYPLRRPASASPPWRSPSISATGTWRSK